MSYCNKQQQHDTCEPEIPDAAGKGIIHMAQTQAQEIAARMLKADTWDIEDCKALCTLAGLAGDWEAAEGETFEKVVQAAAEKLLVEII